MRHARLHEVSSEPNDSACCCWRRRCPSPSPRPSSLAFFRAPFVSTASVNEVPFSTVRSGALAACVLSRRGSFPSSDLRLLFLLKRADDEVRRFVFTADAEDEDKEEEEERDEPLLTPPSVFFFAVSSAAGVPRLAFAPVRYRPRGSVPRNVEFSLASTHEGNGTGHNERPTALAVAPRVAAADSAVERSQHPRSRVVNKATEERCVFVVLFGVLALPT